MVHKFYDKKTKGGGATTLANKSAIKSISQNQHLAEELQKPIIKKFLKRKVYSAFKDNIWDVDLADIQIISKYNKGFRFLLCIFSKYSCAVPLKDKKGGSIVSVFQSILKKSNIKPNKIWVNKGSEFYNTFLQPFFKIVRKK